MKSEQLREKFLAYFGSHGHARVASSPLIPADDPTLLFANAGMNQFKNLFLGLEKRDYVRACSSQKCVRAGGKHNDLENVGYTARHHTFFEMLGNFSFGDYFKKEAIEMAWRFLTEELGLDKSRLYVTVFRDDDEASDLWQSVVGVPVERIFRFGEKDNFWAMGDTGPCGPCSEIFYDFGPNVPGPSDPFEGIESGSDRFMEIWNLVFMQYDRQPDGTLVPLPKPSVDTGMGLERVCAVAQGVYSNYDSDLFQDLLQPIAQHLSADLQNKEQQPGLRVIADHLRAMSFLIADGVVPSNEGRGYVLRRIMRRAMRFGKQLGQEGPFLHELCGLVVEKMGGIYPELVAEAPQIRTLVKVEEQQFDTTLNKGLPILVKYLEKLAADGAKEVPGQIVFFMYGTHGFPLDLMADVARDYGMTLDHKGFERQLAEDGRQSAQEGQFNAKIELPALRELSESMQTEMHCYDGLEAEGQIALLLADEKPVAQLSQGQSGMLVLDRTAFYAESGGQIGDKGVIVTETGRFQVEHTTKAVDKLVVHHGVVESGEISQNQKASSQVDRELRRLTMKNHTATHLLHQALKDCLGRHVRQAGSLVDPEKLRFDFSHFQPLDTQQLAEIEQAVNRQILENIPLQVDHLPIQKAREAGAVALFGEKYGDVVRVVSIADYSKELCGGTHVAATGEIGLFKIISERALASGIRRIIAVTGTGALQRFQESESLLREVQDRFHLKRETLTEQLQKAQEDRKALEQKVEDLKMALAKGGSSQEQQETVNGIQVIVKCVDGVEGGALRQLADELLNKVPGGVVLLGSALGDKAQLVAKVQAKGLHAGELVKVMAEVVGGSGGGRPDMAMAGGKEPQHLPAALRKGLDLIKSSTT
ncbi:MAG: alanine--tRNA ligase [Acidobacteria bacterium]|nr:alanine--tRNA ligase [Acidobacteriota bacterium]MCB9397121.1 alanine--tRNA ligase [Acidobacteriota bacterium]